ncbi:MAG: hypothetical protein RL199_2502, partial [Pseudomonadota bacterium]
MRVVSGVVLGASLSMVAVAEEKTGPARDFAAFQERHETTCVGDPAE